jgi:hypothetical protein
LSVPLPAVVGAVAVRQSRSLRHSGLRTRRYPGVGQWRHP